MTMPEATTSFSIHPRVRFRRVLDEAVVIHQERAEALVLNDTAARFLELCDGALSLGEIADRMAAEYDVEAETLRQDITSFAQDLLDEGLIEAA